ncbi:uncharacterized protein LOC106461481 [Limulus polyphemus]|uniref:Uncharacterized protein LOC106461481 n=1 Tax=Limulus polyphemus TaxID=6850 RepID=A0ABM1SKK4_LIMPO|nr:uncharacterized protein LOC106461481 [Limulus polyphemus]
MDPATWSAYTQHYSRLGSAVSPAAASFSQQAQLNELGLSSTFSRQDHVGGYGAGTTPHPFFLTPHPGLNPPQPSNHVDTSFSSASILPPGYEHNLLSAQFQSAAAKSHFTGLPTGAGFLKAAHKEPDLSDLRGGFAHRGMTPNHMTAGANMAVAMTGATGLGSGALFNPHMAAASWRHSNIVSSAGNPFGSFASEAVMPRSIGVENNNDKVQPQVSKSPRRSIGGPLIDQDLAQTYRNILPSPARPPSSLIDSQNTHSTSMNRQVDSYLNSMADLYTSKPDFRAYSSNSMIQVSHDSISQPVYSSSAYAPLDLHMEKQNVYNTQTEQKMSGATTDKESFLPTPSVIVSPQFQHIQSQRQNTLASSSGAGSESTTANGETLLSQNVQSIHSTHSSEHQLGSSPEFNQEHIFNFGNNMQGHSPFASSAPPSSKSHCSSGSATQEYSPQNMNQNTSPIMQSTYPPMSTPTQAPTPVHPSPSVSVGQAYVPNSFVSSQEDATAIYSSVITQAGTINSNQTNFSTTHSDPSPSPKSHYNGEHTAISQSSVESNHLDMSEQAFFDQLQNPIHSHNVEDNCVLDVVSTPLGSESQNCVSTSRNLMEEDLNMVQQNIRADDQNSPLCSMNTALGMEEARSQSANMQMNSILNGPQPLRSHMQEFTNLMSAEDRMKVYDFDETPEPIANRSNNFEMTGFERKPGKRGRPKGRKNFKKRKTKKSPAWELTSEDYMQLKEAQKNWAHTQRSLSNSLIQSDINEHHFSQTSHTQMPISSQKRSSAENLPPYHSGNPSSGVSKWSLQFGSSYQHSDLDIPVAAFQDSSVHFPKDTFPGISSSLNPTSDQHNSFSFSEQGAQSVPMDVTMSTLQREADQEALRVSIDELASALEASEQNNRSTIPTEGIDDSLSVLQHSTGHTGGTGISDNLFHSNSFDLTSSLGKPPISTSCNNSVLHSSSVDISSFGYHKDAFTIDERGVNLGLKSSNGLPNDNKKMLSQNSSGSILSSFHINSTKRNNNSDCQELCQDWNLETGDLSKSFEKNVNQSEASTSEARYQPCSVNVSSSLPESSVDQDKNNKSIPGIADDFGFLDFPIKSDKKSECGKPGAFGGFFKSFLSFLTDKTEDISANTPFGKRGISRGRVRGRRGRGRGRSFHGSFSSNASGEHFCMYDSVGLSVSRKNDKDSCGKDRSLSPVTGNLTGDSSLFFDSSDLQKMVVPNPEAPSFSSDEEDNATQGIASSVAQALRHLSYETEGASSSLKINEHCSLLASDNLADKPLQAGNYVQACLKKGSVNFTEKKRGKSLNYHSGSFPVHLGRDQISNPRVLGRRFQFFNSSVRRKRGRPPKPRPLVYSNLPGREAHRENKYQQNSEKALVYQPVALEQQGEQKSSRTPEVSPVKGRDQQDDSDSDPVWMPVSRNHERGRGSRGRGRSRRGVGRRPGRRSLSCRDDIGNDSDSSKITFSEGENKMNREKVEEQQLRHSSRYSRRSKQQEVRECLYRFEWIKCKQIKLWRIEGKSLLQRFEAYEADGKVLYRNSSSYTAWNLAERNKYLSATVRVHSNSRDNTVVELLDVQKKEEDKEINGNIVKLTKDENIHPQRENFEVFLQTLISQVLDPNFISEIIKENDEYFLSHVKGIEKITMDQKNLLFHQGSWEPELLQCAEMYPCVNVMPRKDAEVVNCQVCQNVSSDQLVQFYGQVYDQTTLGHQLNPENTKPKVTQFSVCTSCSQKVTLFSRLHHQKYNFFLKCRLKVSAVRGGDDNKESHLILEECLEDNSWVSRMFTEVVEMWNECERRR